MPEVVRRHWRGIFLVCACLSGLAFGFLVLDVDGQQGPGQDYVTEEELVEWWYSQVGKLIWKWWVPLVGFLIVWSWRGFTWQAKTAQAIADNAENVKRNSKAIQELAQQTGESIRAIAKESAESSKETRAEAAAESARIRSLVRKVGEAVIASLDDESERRRLTRGMLDLD